jgi:hypothetical protein
MKLAILTPVLSLGLASLIGIATPAVAGHPHRPALHVAAAQHPTADPRVNRRQHVQRDRIRQGVRSGELNREEAATLRHEQRQIRREERAYKSDGVLTRAERKDLHQDLNAASQNIYEEKHDAEKR